jgi:hypothetical protein
VKRKRIRKPTEYNVTVCLDARTKRIWDKKISKEHNWSEWVRNQLLFHFSGELTTEQEMLLANEERLQLEHERDVALLKINQHYQPLITKKQQQFADCKEALYDGR